MVKCLAIRTCLAVSTLNGARAIVIDVKEQEHDSMEASLQPAWAMQMEADAAADGYTSAMTALQKSNQEKRLEYSPTAPGIKITRFADTLRVAVPGMHTTYGMVIDHCVTPARQSKQGYDCLVPLDRMFGVHFQPSFPDDITPTFNWTLSVTPVDKKTQKPKVGVPESAKIELNCPLCQGTCRIKIGEYTHKWLMPACDSFVPEGVVTEFSFPLPTRSAFAKLASMRAFSSQAFQAGMPPDLTFNMPRPEMLNTYMQILSLLSQGELFLVHHKIVNEREGDWMPENVFYDERMLVSWQEGVPNSHDAAYVAPQLHSSPTSASGTVAFQHHSSPTSASGTSKKPLSSSPASSASKKPSSSSASKKPSSSSASKKPSSSSADAGLPKNWFSPWSAGGTLEMPKKTWWTR